MEPSDRCNGSVFLHALDQIGSFSCHSFAQLSLHVLCILTSELGHHRSSAGATSRFLLRAVKPYNTLSTIIFYTDGRASGRNQFYALKRFEISALLSCFMAYTEGLPVGVGPGSTSREALPLNEPQVLVVIRKAVQRPC